MESFTRVDIFDTKGIEYLFVIGYLVFFILFWNFIRNPRRVTSRVREAMGTLSAAMLQIPGGVYFNRNHTWTHLAPSGIARVGMDDFLQHVTGPLSIKAVKKPGETINKGELMTEISAGGRNLKLYAPISGEIIDINSVIERNPDLMYEDPFKQGWIYRVKPRRWVSETADCLVADEAKEWSENELTRFKEFLAGSPMSKYGKEPAMVMLQDGGEVRENILSELPDDVWVNLQEKFLDP